MDKLKLFWITNTNFRHAVTGLLSIVLSLGLAAAHVPAGVASLVAGVMSAAIDPTAPVVAPLPVQIGTAPADAAQAIPAAPDTAANGSQAPPTGDR